MSETREHVHPQPSANDQETRQTAQLFAAMVAIEPKAAPRLVRYLAEHDNFPLLRTLLAAEVVAAGHEYSAEVVCALAPIVGEGEQEQERADLVSGWLGLLDLDTPAKLGAALYRVDDPESVRDLMRIFGADPLALVPSYTGAKRGDCTALGHALLAHEGRKVTEMLEVLIEQGRDAVARQTEDGPELMFDLICRAGARAGPRTMPMPGALTTVLTSMRDMALPRQWEIETGKSLLSYLDENGSLIDGNDHSILPMLAIARFDDPFHWMRVMEGAAAEHVIPTSLIGKEKEDCALRVIANIKRDGGSTDDLVARLRVGTALVTMPWLHAAVATDRVELVEALLDAGSSPGVGEHWRQDPGPQPPVLVQRDALAVALPGLASEKMILAWKAKQSIGSVLAQAAAAHKEI